MNLNLTFAGFDVGQHDCISLQTSSDSNDKQSYLEMGFGRGVSLCVHAATTDMSFVGTDFNPSHTLFARNLAKVGNADIQLYDDSFELLYKRLQKQEAEFDYIVLHGVWSWVSYENQKVILQIIRDHLKVGGIVYVSYNCFPGWDGKWSSRKLLTMYHDYMSGTKVERIRNALGFFKDFLETNPLYLQNNPSAAQVSQIIENEPFDYLAHEFFNDVANCCYFVDMVRDLESCKLQFACGALPLWHYEDSSLNKQNQAFLDQIAEPTLKEQLKDYYLNRQFRNDIFVKGAQKLSGQQICDKFLNTRFTLTSIPDSDAEDLDAIRKDMIAFLAKDSYTPKSMREAQLQLGGGGLHIRELAKLVADMMTSGYIHPVTNKDITDSIAKRSIDFNRHIFSNQCKKQYVRYAAAPLIGGGVLINEVSQVFLYGLMSGVDEKGLGAFAWDILKAQGRKLNKAGVDLESDKENIKELDSVLQDLLPKIPLYKNLGII